MTRRHLRFCAIVFTFLLPLGAARAQVATGTPPFGSFSGGPDIVNNANLNVHITVPVLNKAGRGLPFSYVLSYDSSIWYPAGNVWTPVTNTNWGWDGVNQAATGYVTYNWTEGSCQNPHGPVQFYDIYSGWVYYDT